MKLAPNTFRVRFRTSSSDLVACSGVKPDSCSMPRPPALETAAASGGLASDPMGGICIGTLQPVNSVKFVLSMRPQGVKSGIEDLSLSEGYQNLQKQTVAKRGMFLILDC